MDHDDNDDTTEIEVVLDDRTAAMLDAYEAKGGDPDELVSDLLAAHRDHGSVEEAVAAVKEDRA